MRIIRDLSATSNPEKGIAMRGAVCKSSFHKDLWQLDRDVVHLRDEEPAVFRDVVPVIERCTARECAC